MCASLLIFKKEVLNITSGQYNKAWKEPIYKAFTGGLEMYFQENHPS